MTYFYMIQICALFLGMVVFIAYRLFLKRREYGTFAALWDAFLSSIVTIAFIGKLFFFEPSYIPSPSMYPTIQNSDFVFVVKERVPGENYRIRDLLLSVPWIGWRFFKAESVDLESIHNGAIITFYNGDYLEYCKRVIALPGQRFWYNGDDIMVENDNGAMESISYNEKGELFYPEETYIFKQNDTETPMRKRICRIRIKGTNKFVEFQRLLDQKQSMDQVIEGKVPQGYLVGCGDNTPNSHDSRYKYFGFVPLAGVKGRLVAVLCGSKHNVGADDPNMDWIQWIIQLPYNVVRYILAIDFSRPGRLNKVVIDDGSFKPQNIAQKEAWLEEMDARLKAQLDSESTADGQSEEDTDSSENELEDMSILAQDGSEADKSEQVE